MIVEFRVSLFLLFVVFRGNSEIYLENTNDVLEIEFYDCVRVYSSSLSYCRRPKEAIHLSRDNQSTECQHNGAQLHRFSELQAKNISTSTILHQWKSTLERLEDYQRYRRDSSSQLDGFICECRQRGTFGKNCEYQLPVGETFEETLQWQLLMRKENPEKVQIYGDVVCYETLECDSGVLCLDWREICDGVQHCLEGRDEENCDLLEMNQCEEDEYRCVNGMCISDEFFVDGQFDCLDWSDELPFKESEECAFESVNRDCDDHVCPRNDWSCGDGQCIENRLAFQEFKLPTCVNERDQYFICETHERKLQWTMSNGRCADVEDGVGSYEESSSKNRSSDEECSYLVQCSLSMGGEKDCPCGDSINCDDQLAEECLSSSSGIVYPRRSIGGPFLFFLFNLTRDWSEKRPDGLLINGTVRCGHSLIIVKEKRIFPFKKDSDIRHLIEDHFCRPTRSVFWEEEEDQCRLRDRCHHGNETIDLCLGWNPCVSQTRIRDGSKECLNSRDVDYPINIDKSCAQVRPYRFHCSYDQPTCLPVNRLATKIYACLNLFDIKWFGSSRHLSLMNCHPNNQDDCSLLRQYIEQSSTASTFINDTETQQPHRIPFRSFCDTFSDLDTKQDENLRECQRWWICPEDQRICQSGQCIELNWFDDRQWDCADASDEHKHFNSLTQHAFKGASRYDFTNRSYFIPRSCPHQSHPFLCLSANATRQGFSCFNLSQIGDGHIDCAGGFDERMTLQYCSSSSSILDENYLCLSTNTCIHYDEHCSTKTNARCPRRSDDQFWCEREHQQSENSSDQNSFRCFHERRAKRCDFQSQCLFAEDEYMCALFHSTQRKDNRGHKQALRKIKTKFIRFSAFPPDAYIKQFHLNSLSTTTIVTNLSSSSSSSISPYWCNRGLGVLSTKNKSTIVCFCPPQYYGDKCSFHADRLSVVLHLNLTQSIYSTGSDSSILFQVVVVLLVNEQVLERDLFHFHPSTSTESVRSKFVSYFVFSHRRSSREERQRRFSNRSFLVIDHPHSIRFELYLSRRDKQPSLIAVWNYPLPFTHLPVSRLAKVLHLSESLVNRCSSRPCRHPNEECHPLMNNRSQFICLCKEGFKGENCSRSDEQCHRGYCAEGSLCQPASRGSSLSSPFCLCSFNRYGKRCEIEHDGCLSSSCLNGGSCSPSSQPSRVICVCRNEYSGSVCQRRRSSIGLSVSPMNVVHRGAVIQYFRIDFISFDIHLVTQHVFLSLPSYVEYFHDDHRTTLPEIVLAKLYSTSLDGQNDLYLLSVHLNVSSLNGRTQISEINRCEHRRTFLNVNSSPIGYHQLCIDNRTRLCFRDNVYLCLCGQNHSRVECFLYDNQLDRCSRCLAHGRCLKGNHRLTNDFICLCPECHSGDRCQFNTRSFSFTLDQLFSSDLLKDDQRQRTFSLLLFFVLVGFFLALLSNLFSFVTLHRSSCLRQGVGHYLLWLTGTNQFSVSFLAARLIHLSVIISISRSSSSLVDDLFCKLLHYLLTSFTRLSSWLPSFVALERVYSTVFFNKHRFNQPHVARRVLSFSFALILLSGSYELVFYKSLVSTVDGNSAMCVIEYPPNRQSLWIFIHQLVSIIHFLVPFLINLCSTLTIMIVVLNNKINIHRTKNMYSSKTHTRVAVLQDVFNENREMITRPAIALIPSMFSLFSLPLFIISFSLGCQNLEDNPLRYLLITFYFFTFIPQIGTFYLYIFPSSCYWKQWQSTSISQWINTRRWRHPLKNITSFSTSNGTKTGYFSSILNTR